MSTRCIFGHSGAVNAVRLNSDGNYCMTAGDDRTVRLWNPSKDDPSKEPGMALQIKNYTGVHGYQVLDVAIAKDNTKFASGGGDRVGFLWDVASGRVIRRLQGHSQRINAVELNPEATVLLTGSYDQTLCLWDLRANSREPIQTLRDFSDSVTSIVCTNSSIIAGSVDGNLRNYDMRSGLLQTDSCDDPITDVRLTNDGKCALVTCLGGIIRLINLSDGKQLQSYGGNHAHEKFKAESCVTSDDCNIITCSEDGYFVQYGLVSGQFVKRTSTSTSSNNNNHHHTIKASAAGEEEEHRVIGSSSGNHALSSICYHPSKPFMISASYDGTVKVWENPI